MKNKDIYPRNENNEPHGLWEVYQNNGNLSWKGNFINGFKVGLYEFYKHNGELYNKTYYIR